MPVRQIDVPSSKQVGDPIRLLLNLRFKRETSPALFQYAQPFTRELLINVECGEHHQKSEVRRKAVL